MNYLLTGATGYLGSRLLDSLLNDGCRLTVLKRSTSDTSRIKENLEDFHCYDVDFDGINAAFENHAPFDAVIHTATCYGRNGESDLQLVESNLHFPLMLLDRSKDGGAKAFINTDTSLPAELNAYALSKKQFVGWGRKAAEAGGLQWVNLVLEHFYGPGDSLNKLVTWLAKECLTSPSEIPLTFGEQRRDFIYIDDLLCAFKLILNDKNIAPSLEYAIGSGVSVEIREIAERIRVLCNSSAQLSFGAVPYRDNEVMNSCADITNLQKIGWKSTYSLEEGLNELIKTERGRFL